MNTGTVRGFRHDRKTVINDVDTQYATLRLCVLLLAAITSTPTVRMQKTSLLRLVCCIWKMTLELHGLARPTAGSV